MAIPPFEDRPGYPYRVLPEGAHPTDEPGFRARFVEEFPGSGTRSRICEGFFRLRAEAAALGIAATQWVDGSFVEEKQDPEDVDVASFVDGDAWQALPAETRQLADFLLNGDAGTKPGYGTHALFVATYPPGHPRFELYDSVRGAMRDWLGRTPAGPDRQCTRSYVKGFVTMDLGDPARVPAVSTERMA